jgi:hypothetical protein
MDIFFDVDDTIISSFDGTLRPLIPELFRQLTVDGHGLYIWSGVGIRWGVVDRYDLRSFVQDCFMKPLFDHRNRLAELGVTVEPQFCVDDYREITEAFGGFTVRPYAWADQHDREMERVYQAICAAVDGSAFETPPGLSLRSLP